MYPINRDLTAEGRVTTPIIKFFTQSYLEYSIDSALVNQFLLITIHNFINYKDARYRYLEQIPYIIISLIYYISLACFACLITIFTWDRELWKWCCITSITQTTISLVLLYLSIIGSFSPPHAIHIALFYGEKVVEIFDRDREETKKICDFIKNFWESYRIRMQNWMLSAEKLTLQNQLTYQIRVMNTSKRLKNLSDIKKLFWYTVSAN